MLLLLYLQQIIFGLPADAKLTGQITILNIFQKHQQSAKFLWQLYGGWMYWEYRAVVDSFVEWSGRNSLLQRDGNRV